MLDKPMDTAIATETPARTRGCCVPVAPPLPAERAEAIAAVHRALADPTRVQMLRMLDDAGGPLCVCDLTAAFAQSQPTISHHLAKLRDAGFVHSEKHGIWAFYSLREDMPDACRAAMGLLR
jgi:ArsR family transcriptional regulator, arsenate/arsenite/antimonite-responsive transcriptional repressor